jgi:hypothetical protein
VKAEIKQLKKNILYFFGKFIVGEVYHHRRFGKVVYEGSALENKCMVYPIETHHNYPFIVDQKALFINKKHRHLFL